jgi:hypothetical protein
MRVTQEQKHNAGVKLWQIVERYKEIRPDLNDKQVLKLAMMSNPDLAEHYLGCAVRRDEVDEARRYLMNIR